eukprot:NODE_58_length_28395_cov_1.465720.p5 type:complete len:436 gc:universal NODE_58_length_28395_cov_1.465720:12894-14201(+)
MYFLMKQFVLISILCYIKFGFQFQHLMAEKCADVTFKFNSILKYVISDYTKIKKIYLDHIPVIFPNNKDAYNPGVIQLPGNSKYPYLMVGRKPPLNSYEPEGLDLKYGEPVYCYGKVKNNQLICLTPEKKVNAKTNWNAVKNRLKNGIKDASSKYDYQDPRVFYGKYDNRTEIFISFSCPSNYDYQVRTTCIGLAISVIPDLFDMLPPDYSTNGNIELSHINVKGLKDKYVKNLSPISSDFKIMIYSIKPFMMIKHALESQADIIFKEEETPECLNFESNHLDIHLATNSLHIALCESPCKPKLSETRVMLMLHVKINVDGLHYPVYKRFLAFLDPITYKLLRISPFLEIKDFESKELIFDSNMNFAPNPLDYDPQNSEFHGMTLGYLNTQIILTLGVDLRRQGRLAYFTAKEAYLNSFPCNGVVANTLLKAEYP